MTCVTAFEFRFIHGKCVGVVLPELDELSVDSQYVDSQYVDSQYVDSQSGELHALELEMARNMKPRRQKTFIGGRVAMRRALDDRSLFETPILVNARGAPEMPAGWRGSISHKEKIAVALASQDTKGYLGVDVESTGPSKHKIQSMILRKEEEAELGNVEGISMAEEILLRFSMKESVYKSLDPYVKRYVGFREVAVRPHDDGTGDISFFLEGNEGPFATELSWRREGGFFLTTALTIRPAS